MTTWWQRLDTDSVSDVRVCSCGSNPPRLVPRLFGGTTTWKRRFNALPPIRAWIPNMWLTAFQSLSSQSVNVSPVHLCSCRTPLNWYYYWGPWSSPPFVCRRHPSLRVCRPSATPELQNSILTFIDDAARWALQPIPAEYCEHGGPLIYIQSAPPYATSVTSPSRHAPIKSSQFPLCATSASIRRRRCVDEVALHKDCRCLLRDPASAAERSSFITALRPTVTGRYSPIWSSGSSQWWIMPLGLCFLLQGSITTSVTQLHWLKAPERIEFKLAVLVYRCLQQTLPLYLAEESHQLSDLKAHKRLFSASSSSLAYWCSRLSTIGDRAFPVAAARLWNTAAERHGAVADCFRKRFIFYFLKSPAVHVSWYCRDHDL